MCVHLRHSVNDRETTWVVMKELRRKWAIDYFLGFLLCSARTVSSFPAVIELRAVRTVLWWQKCSCSGQEGQLVQPSLIKHWSILWNLLIMQPVQLFIILWTTSLAEVLFCFRVGHKFQKQYVTEEVIYGEIPPATWKGTKRDTFEPTVVLRYWEHVFILSVLPLPF